MLISTKNKDKEPRTPLPNPQFIILLCIRFIEPISFTLIFPFVYFMVEDFHVTDNPKQIAFYAGFVSSAFAIGEFVSGVPWGILSDRIGRKPVILLGLLGTLITMLAFGFSKSLAWAITTRFLSGALNGNIGVLKSMVGEMTDRSNRALGFSYMAMVFGLGNIVGPALGGFLANPVKNIPSIFGGNTFFTEYPYFLPCIICCIFDAAGIIFGYFYLEETLNKDFSKSDPESTSLPTILDPVPETTIPKELNNQSTETRSTSIAKATWIVIISYISLSLLNIMFDELFPFWSASAIEDGGLEYQSTDIGLVSSILGVVLVFVQLFLYPTLQHRFSTIILYRVAMILLVPVIACVPLVSFVPGNGLFSGSWWLLIFLMGLKTFGAVFAFTSFNILLPESCATKQILGKVNGIAQSLGSLMRGFGPSLCGALFSWSLTNNIGYPLNYHFTFYIICLLSIITFFLVNRIRPESLIY